MPIIPNEVVKEYHNTLLKNKSLLSNICKLRGLEQETIEDFKIGYDIKSKRYTIPIYTTFGDCVNIRKYSSDMDPKIISYDKGYGENRLFNLDKGFKDRKNVVICEGEWDCILLNQYGLYAITGTCGVTSWDNEWNKYFIGKNVVIIFDCDKVGKDGSKKIGEKLINISNKLKIVDLELGDKEDVTDWFCKYKKSKDELVDLIKNVEEMDMYSMIQLGEGMNPKWYNRKIKWHGVVIGKDLSPYLIPKVVEASCRGCDSKKAMACPLKEEKLKITYDYNENKESIIKFINSPDNQIKGIIRSDLGIPSGNDCKYVKIETTERQLIEDISLIPEVNFEHERIDEKEHVNRRAFVFGNSVQTNQTYLFRGTTWSDPKSQMGIHLITDKKSSRDSISKFIIDETIKNKLKTFQPRDPKDPQAIWNKLEDIYTDWTHNVTRIYGRHNLLTCVDLVYHSVIDFNFLGRPINKGWLECAVVGDTRTGKTETIKNMVRFYKAGEFLTSGENTTRSGILGGAQQHNNRWTLTWGKIPLNDKRFIAIDEADNLAESGIIQLLSGVRSSGIAEVVMIQTQKTTARTRILWIANPLKGRITEHNYGVETIKEIFGKQQDISRIDFAMVCAKEEVDKEAINRIHEEKYPHKYTSEIAHACVMWAWNRHYNDIVFTKGTEQLILDKANELGEKYSPDIPLILDAEARVKIARMSVALATRLFSTDDEGDKVYVYPAHVEVVTKFLQVLYDDKFMGFEQLSRRYFKKSSIANEKEIDDLFQVEDNIDMFLDMKTVQLNDIEDIYAIDRDQAREILRKLRLSRSLVKKSWYYRKTPQFIQYLKKRKSEIIKNF